MRRRPSADSAGTLERLRPQPLRRGMLASGARSVVTLVVMAAAFPVMLHQLGQAGFGLWAVLTVPTGMLGLAGFGVAPATVSLLGRALGAARSAADPASAEAALVRGGAVSGATILISAGTAGIAGIVCWSLAATVVGLVNVPAEEVASAILLFRCAGLCLAAMLIGWGFTAHLEAMGRIDLSALNAAVVSVANVMMLIVAVFVAPGFRALALVQLVTAGANLGLPLVLLRLSGGSALFGWTHLDGAVTREVMRLAAGLGGASAMTAVTDPLIKLVLGSVNGPVAVAAYELAARVVFAVNGVFSSVLAPLLPHVSAAVGAGHGDDVAAIVAMAVRRGTALAYPTYAALAASASALTVVWLGGDVPHGSATSIAVLLCGLALSFAAMPAYQAMQGMGHGRRVLYVQLAGLGAVATVLALDAGGVVRGPAVGALAFAVGAATGAVITLVQYRALNGPGFVGDVLRGTLPGVGLAALAIPWAPVAAALGARPLVQLVAAGLAWAAIVGVTVRRGPYLQSRRRVS